MNRNELSEMAVIGQKLHDNNRTDQAHLDALGWQHDQEHCLFCRAGIPLGIGVEQPDRFSCLYSRDDIIGPDHMVVHKEEDPFTLDPRLLGNDDDGWSDVPFWFAWMVWTAVVTAPVGLGAAIVQKILHSPDDAHAVIASFVLAGVIGWLVTLIIRTMHNAKTSQCEPIPYSEDAERSYLAKPAINRGRLHRFSLTVGFRHERLDDGDS